MKKTVGALLLCAVSACYGETVTVTGHGSNPDSALQNAKEAAIGQVTGTWLNSEHQFKNGTYNEKIDEYNGGVIKSYKIVSATADTVTITADVDVVKNNRVNGRSFNVPDSMRQELNQKAEKNALAQKAISNLDSKNKAFSVHVNSIQYANLGQSTQVMMDVVVAWNPKWLSDVESLSKTMNQKTSPTNSVRPGLAGAGVVAAMGAFGVPGALVSSILYGPAKGDVPEHRPENAVCFGNKAGGVADDCYLTNVGFNNFAYSSTQFDVVGLSDGNKVFSDNANIDNMKLYRFAAPGSYSMGHFDVKYTYNNPTLIVYKDEAVKLKLKFTVPTQQLAQVDKFDIVFK